MKILFLHEFGPESREWHMQRFADALEKRHERLQVLYHSGFLKDYLPGGLHVLRFINLLYCYFTFPLKILWHKPALVLVRTAPPGIQIVISAICVITGTTCWLWLMDYHPELEARHLERKWWGGWLAWILRSVDIWALKNFGCIIAINESIACICQKRAPNVPMIVHPTWSPETEIQNASPVQIVNIKMAFRGIYVGHLGYAHDLNGMQRILNNLPTEVSVKLIFVNVSEAGKRKVGHLKHPKLTIETFPMKSVEELKNLIEANSIQWGFVCLGDLYKGVLSPSKFHLYLELGLPVLYTGPSQTNAWKACTEFNAGIAFTSDSATEEWDILNAELLDYSRQKELQANCANALDYFDKFGPESLAQELEPMLKAVGI